MDELDALLNEINEEFQQQKHKEIGVDETLEKWAALKTFHKSSSFHSEAKKSVIDVNQGEIIFIPLNNDGIDSLNCSPDKGKTPELAYAATPNSIQFKEADVCSIKSFKNNMESVIEGNVLVGQHVSNAIPLEKSISAIQMIQTRTSSTPIPNSSISNNAMGTLTPSNIADVLVNSQADTMNDPSTTMGPGGAVFQDLDDILNGLNKNLEDLEYIVGSSNASTTKSSPSLRPRQLSNLTSKIKVTNLKSVNNNPQLNLKNKEEQREEGKYKTCRECCEDIIGKFIQLGQDLYFHPNHFRCEADLKGENGKKCGRLLTLSSYVDREGVFYCLQCNHEYFSPRCGYCEEIIKDKYISALGKCFHYDHFFCAQCGKAFKGKFKYLEYDGQAYCEEDYLALFTTSCAGCGKPTTDDYLMALDKSWHPNCLKCFDCHKVFSIQDQIFEQEGKPLCSQHYHERLNAVCATCQKPIIGKCVTALEKRYHEHHFQCKFCKLILQGTGFKQHKDHPYCSPCYLKLFG